MSNVVYISKSRIERKLDRCALRICPVSPSRRSSAFMEPSLSTTRLTRLS